MLTRLKTIMSTLALLAGIPCIAVCAAIFTVQSASAQEISTSAAKQKINCTCPANTTTDFYANPVVDRSSCAKKKGYAPTGVSNPSVCSYPTLTEALVAATGSLVHFPSARAIASGGSVAAPAVFASESFPLSIIGGVTLTSTGDPTANVILVNAASGNALDVRSNGVLSGFTLQNGGGSGGSAVQCDGSNVSVNSMILDGLHQTDRLETGLLLSGSCDGTFSEIEARNFSGQGILVSSESATDSVLSQLDLHHNHIGLRALRGNFVVKQTSTIPGDLSRVHDNTGTLDSTAAPTAGMGYGIVLGDPQNQQGMVKARIENTIVETNDIGVLVQQADTDTKSTHWTLYANEIIVNRAWGVWIYPSFLEIDSVGVGFSGNVIGNNGWVSADACQSALDNPPPGPAAENYSQIVFWGAYLASAELTTLCSSFDVEVNGGEDDPSGCNATPLCVFNTAAPTLKCRPAWDLSGTGCTDTNANTIAGYHRNGPENEDQRVGIVVGSGAWVKANYDHFLTGAFEQQSDWTANDTSSFAGNSGTTCAPAPQKCPAAH